MQLDLYLCLLEPLELLVFQLTLEMLMELCHLSGFVFQMLHQQHIQVLLLLQRKMLHYYLRQEQELC